MKHERYNHLPSTEKYLVVESSGSANKKTIYRSKKSDLFNLKNEINIFKYDKKTHYMNHLLIRNKKTNNLLAYYFLCLEYFGKVRIDYYSEISEAIKEINNTKFNSLYMTPSIFWNFKDKMNISHYEYIFLAGEEMSKTVKETLLNMTNAKVFDMYGGTDCGLIAYRNVREDIYLNVLPDLKLIKNSENRLEFLRDNSGACDFIQDENGIYDLRKNKTYIGNDFIEIIEDKKIKFLGRDDSFVKINDKRIFLNQIKKLFIDNLKITDIQLLKYKDENGFDQFCMYLISDEKYEIKHFIDLILSEFNSINYMPKKILFADNYLTKELNSGQIIKTDTKKLLEMVLENGKQTY
jgi:phenylacetate-coenzyme A ligase PaaK-like adenylate-forming protein